MLKDEKLLAGTTKSDHVGNPSFKKYITDLISQISGSEEHQNLAKDVGKAEALVNYSNQIKIGAIDLSSAFFTDEQLKFLFSQHFALLETLPSTSVLQLQDISNKFTTEVSKRDFDKKTITELLRHNFTDYIDSFVKNISAKITEDPKDFYAPLLAKYIKQIVSNEFDLSTNNFSDEEFKAILEQHEQLLTAVKTTRSFNIIDGKLIEEANKRSIRPGSQPSYNPLLIARITIGFNSGIMK